MRNVSTYRMGKTLAHGRCSVNICQSYIGIILIHGPDSEMCSTFHAESDKHSAWPTVVICEYLLTTIVLQELCLHPEMSSLPYTKVQPSVTAQSRTAPSQESFGSLPPSSEFYTFFFKVRSSQALSG